MTIVTTTRLLNPQQFLQINNLWNGEYPIKLKDRFVLLLERVTNYNHYLVVDENNMVLAWAVCFEKDCEMRFSIIVSKQHQGKGFGKLLIDKLKQDYKEFYGWVIDHNEDVKSNGENYQTPMPFYLKHGFEILHDIRLDTEMIRAVKIKWEVK